MATFYGQVFGNAKTTASRTGSAASGIKTSAQSYDGSVIVDMHYRQSDGQLMTWIEVNDGSASSGKLVFSGTLDELCKKLCGQTVEQVYGHGSTEAMRVCKVKDTLDDVLDDVQAKFQTEIREYEYDMGGSLMDCAEDALKAACKRVKAERQEDTMQA